jgi:hypothetical protein
MTLTEMLTTLVTQGALAAKYANNTKTSLNYLARALGHAGADQCPVEALCGQDGDALLTTLEAHFAALTAQGHTTSAKTRSNTRNTVRVVLRTAEARGLLLTPPALPVLRKPQRRELFKAHQRETAPYQSSYHPTTSPRTYGLPQREWPPECQSGWEQYLAKCDLSIRPIRLQANVDTLALYFGYLAHIVGRPPRWEDLFAWEQLRAFVRWHAERLKRPIPSSVGWQVVIVAATIAKVLEHPHARDLADKRNELGAPEEVHDKHAHHWITLKELDAAAEAWLQDGRVPAPPDRRNRHHGARLAGRFQKGVILKLLIHAPIRIRNIRELQLKKNLLYEEKDTHWHLRFRGSELKIGMRGTRTNEYHIDLTEHAPDFLPVLTEFLDVYRKRLPGAESSDYLFLNHQGRPFTANLSKELKIAVGLKTGKRFFPHLIRTVWATEYLTHPKTYGDYQTAATMLGDTVQMVIKAYSPVVEKVHHQRAAAFLTRALKKDAPATEEAAD